VGVNKYLNHYVNVADAKAAGVLTVDFALGGYLMGKLPTVGWTILFHWTAVGLLIGSGIAAILTLYPRTPKVGSSLIFWDDIRSRGNMEAYFADLRSVDDMEVERQYAAQNYVVSTLLADKYQRVRQAIIGLLAAVPFAMLRLIAG
jgi:hypothetical protein